MPLAVWSFFLSKAMVCKVRRQKKHLVTMSWKKKKQRRMAKQLSRARKSTCMRFPAKLAEQVKHFKVFT